MVNYIKVGNIFQLDGVYNYAHGCNCMGVMGKGIALQFKKKFPQMYKEYREKCLNNEFKPGDVFEYNYDNNYYVFNLGTQASWKVKATLCAIEESLTKMLFFASKKGITPIALPRIGGGLGGLNWNEVKSVINKVSSAYPDIDLWVIENYNEQ